MRGGFDCTIEAYDIRRPDVLRELEVLSGGCRSVESRRSINWLLLSEGERKPGLELDTLSFHISTSEESPSKTPARSRSSVYRCFSSGN